MASYRKYLIGCIYRFQFRPRLGSLQAFSIPCHLSSVRKMAYFFLRKFLIISYTPHTDVEIHS